LTNSAYKKLHVITELLKSKLRIADVPFTAHMQQSSLQQRITVYS